MSKFNLGQVVATRGVAYQMQEDKDFYEFVQKSFTRHATGDWGDLDEEDKEANEYALTHNDRIFSSYIKGEWKIYIITEWDRSYTTILFPSEY